MVNSSPLLLLLDGVLSMEERSVNSALEQIQALIGPHVCIRDSPLQSASALECVVEQVMMKHPELAQLASSTDGSLPLHFAASIGNVRVASLLLQQYPDGALKHNTKGKIPLHYAAREGRVNMVSFFLDLVPKCASVLTKKGKLALHFAAGDGHVEVVRALLKVHPQGASIPSKKGKVALHFAARWGHLAIAHDLYQLCPQCVYTLDFDGSTPLHDAAREGQLEMAKFLVERYPQAMGTANIRGEVPLFGAIRSGNVELCAYFVRSWPQCGRQVLQMVREEDGVDAWDPAILNLCLRGAVDNFSDLRQNEEGDEATPIVPYTFGLHQDMASATSPPHAVSTGSSNSDVDSNLSNSEASDEVSMINGNAPDALAAPLISTTSTYRLTPGLDITLPRSKSPILEADGCGKKRSAAEGTNSNKRSRRGSMEDEDVNLPQQILAKQTFYQLHAALECSATTNVLECVLSRYPEQLTQVDDLGKLPLHVAVEHCRSEGSVQFILDRIWRPYKQAAFQRDYLSRLPLHLSLMTRADCRLIEVLLEANPSSGVEHCETVDLRFVDKLPIHMASAYGCDLSTIFLLTRIDPSVVQTWEP
mmetsp:Transcript_32557/g.54525  ORF Transcript_32557/g.54525 Transcript_32557/m.54525 type:complete len:591 (+) Transcript_32557:1378-3150(+)